MRFKNYGLDAIEVVDNGDGISRDNYENIGISRSFQLGSHKLMLSDSSSSETLHVKTHYL